MDVSRDRYAVTIHWEPGDRLVRAEAEGKPALQVATDPRSPGGVEGHWTPDDLLLAAAGSCYALIFVSLAERLGVPLHGLQVEAKGELGRGTDGRVRLVHIALTVRAETDAGSLAPARRAAAVAEEYCSVVLALDQSLNLDVELAVPASRH
jgi:organic hydroperoxide reductase OsmC/OhrA